MTADALLSAAKSDFWWESDVC